MGRSFRKSMKTHCFVADWSYGNIHAVHLTPDGSSYTGEYETFATAAPLPVTDMVVHPEQGSLYFAVGGRRTQSGLYRIVFRGEMSNDAGGDSPPLDEKRRALRADLETLHVADANSEAVTTAIEGLGGDDRAIRFAARIALEHQPVDSWRKKIAEIEDDNARILWRHCPWLATVPQVIKR